jgi:uncharacterized Zn-binding protein involved in type VI secretion
MPPVVRVGDVNSAGGEALGGVSNVIVNGRPISVNGNPVTGHGSGIHQSPTTAIGSTNVFASGIKIQYVGGCVDTCGHARSTGSPDVIVGG